MSSPSGSRASPDDGTPAPPRHRRAAATQEQLVTAARAVFEQKGYQATSVGAITERANTAHGTFYLYFRNKEDVFSAVMSDAVDELYAEASARWERLDGHEGVRDAISAFLQVFVAHRGLWRCLLEGMLARPSIEQMWLALRRPFIARIGTGLERLVESGEVRAVDPKMAANALGAMVEWFAFTHLVLDEPPAGDGGVERAASVLADLWVNAVYGRVDGAG